jgi:hypothetical protein
MSDGDKKDDKTVEDKAVEIGKKVEDAAPDYEVTELPDEKADEAGVASDKKVDDKKDDAEDDDDRRLSKKDREDADNQHRPTNREKRQLKKRRLAEKFDAKDALIRQQQDQLNSMAAKLNEVDGRLSSFDQAQFTQTWNASVEAFNAAEAKHAAAFSAGDGAAATVAMREMYQAQRTIDQLESVRQRQAVQPQRQQVQPPKHDPRVVSKAQAWAENNKWFKPGSVDDDSAMADALAAKLKREGYDPTTNDYWDELDERLEKKGIGARDEQDDDDGEEDAKPARRRSPPVGGGSGGGRSDLGNGKVAVSLPTAFVNALKQNGYWDDPVKKSKMIAGYLKGVKERGEA